MAREFTVAGWEIIHGGEWQIHRELEPGIVSAIEGRRFSHFDGSGTLWSDTWTLDYHFNPRIRFCSEQCAWRERTPRTWHLYPPGIAFRQDTRASTLPIHALWIRFHGAEKLGLGKLIDPDSSLQMAILEDPHHWLMDKIRSFTALRDADGEASYTDVAVGLMEIIQRLRNSLRIGESRYRVEAEATAIPRDPVVEKIDAYLVAHLHESVTLSRIARDLHSSVPTIKRRYSAACGCSIIQSLLRLRISRVKQLLGKGASVAEAADQTGFFDPFHLSKTFKRYEGIPPRQYIARLKRP